MGMRGCLPRTHCMKGHLYTPETTLYCKEGWKTCRICKYAAVAAYRLRPGIAKKRADKERVRQKDPLVKRRVFDVNRFKFYKLTPEAYKEMVRKQDGKCAICGIDFSDLKRKPCVDHNHYCCPTERTCGKCIRGIICGNCNHGLGHFKDNKDSLKAAVDYLESYEGTERIPAKEFEYFNRKKGVKYAYGGPSLKDAEYLKK